MSLILEDGTAPAGANSYATEPMADDYFEARGNTNWTDSTSDKEAALIRATAAIDAMYRNRFSGYRTMGRAQGLEWPRSSAYDAEALILDGDEIPIEIINATCEAAARELASPGSMMPDLERGGSVRRLKAGSVEVEYGANAAASTVFSLIDGILAGLLTYASSASFVGRAERG